MSYNLRATSLFGAHLDTELTKRGARTSGSTARKQQRLKRFVEAESRKNQARDTLRVVVQNEQRKVYERVQARATDGYNTRSKRGIISLIQEYLA